MAEFTNPLEKYALLISGLTNSELKNRGVIAVGYFPGELLPEYFDDFHERRAREILDYMEKAGPLAVCALQSDIHRINLKGRKVFEIVGGLADVCVPEAVKHVVRSGRLALVDAGRIFCTESKLPNPELAKMVIEGIRYTEIRQVAVGRGQFLYYPQYQS